jgi:hypothetical protein
MTSAPSRSAAAHWNSNNSDRSRLPATWPRGRPGEANARDGDAAPGSELDQFGGVRADLLLGRGRQVRWLGRRLARVRRSAGDETGGPPRTVSPHHDIN